LSKVEFGGFLPADGQNHEKFVRRVDALLSDFNHVVEDIHATHPCLKGKVFVSYSNLVLAVGRYFNDLALFYAEHDVVKFHRGKIPAYLIKWFLLHPPIVSTLSQEEYHSLDSDCRSTVLNLGYIPIQVCVNHFMDTDVFLSGEIRPELRKTIDKNFERLYYYAKTGNYSAKMATLFFELLIDAH
jgi:hypothetical protein